jgi:hypothetical protein
VADLFGVVKVRRSSAYGDLASFAALSLCCCV